MSDCPACECPEYAVLELRTWRGVVWEKRRCADCGKVWSAQSESHKSNLVAEPVSDRVFRYVLRCPNCGATEPPVASTLTLGRRRHKCGECGHAFKSIERG